MDLSFTQEQDMLRETARKFVDAECGSEKVRAVMDSPDGHDRALWAKIVDQGWCALVIPEAHGGLGLEFADLAIILIDARKGVLTQTLRHSYLVHLLGIKHVVLAVNKMDLVGFAEGRFAEIVAERVLGLPKG